eukprot:1954527-Amphidinium_carterae.1
MKLGLPVKPKLLPVALDILESFLCHVGTWTPRLACRPFMKIWSPLDLLLACFTRNQSTNQRLTLQREVKSQVQFLSLDVVKPPPYTVQVVGPFPTKLWLGAAQLSRQTSIGAGKENRGASEFSCVATSVCKTPGKFGAHLAFREGCLPLRFGRFLGVVLGVESTLELAPRMQSCRLAGVDNAHHRKLKVNRPRDPSFTKIFQTTSQGTLHGNSLPVVIAKALSFGLVKTLLGDSLSIIIANLSLQLPLEALNPSSKVDYR